MARRKRARPVDEDVQGEQETKPVIQRREGKMPIINFNEYDLDSIPELKILPAGSEVKLRILEVTINTDRNGDDMIAVRLDVSDEPLVKEIYWRCHMPNSRSMSEKRVIMLRRFLSDFCDAFEIDKSADQDTSDWLGKEGWSILSVRTDPKYGDSNEVGRWLRQK